MHELTWLPDIYSKFKKVAVIIIFLKKTAYAFMLMWKDITAPSHTHCTSIYTVRTCCAAMKVLAETGRSSECRLDTSSLRFTPPYSAISVAWLILWLYLQLHVQPLQRNNIATKQVSSCLISIGHLGSCLSQRCVVKFSKSFPNCLDCVWVLTIWHMLSSFVVECFFSSVSRPEPILCHRDTPSYCMVYTNI